MRATGLRICLLVGWLFCASAAAQKVEFYDTGEEFAGPFPSWKNVKTDYGAKGDGVTDDAPAIQRSMTFGTCPATPGARSTFPPGPTASRPPSRPPANSTTTGSGARSSERTRPRPSSDGTVARANGCGGSTRGTAR